jgi:hypothetical protein
MLQMPSGPLLLTGQCQVSAWPDHRQYCFDHQVIVSWLLFDRDPQGPSPEGKRPSFGGVERFTDLWGTPLQWWAVFGANLANQSADFLQTHWSEATVEACTLC